MMTAHADVTLSMSKSVADIRIVSITLNFQGPPKSSNLLYQFTNAKQARTQQCGKS